MSLHDNQNTRHKISLALSSRRDNHPFAVIAKMAILIVAAFSFRLSRYKSATNLNRGLARRFVTVLSCCSAGRSRTLAVYLVGQKRLDKFWADLRRAVVNFYDHWMLPPILDLVMRQISSRNTAAKWLVLRVGGYSKSGWEGEIADPIRGLVRRAPVPELASIGRPALLPWLGVGLVDRAEAIPHSGKAAGQVDKPRRYGIAHIQAGEKIRPTDATGSTHVGGIYVHEFD